MDSDIPADTPVLPTRPGSRRRKIGVVIAIVLGLAFAVDYIIFEKTMPTLLSEPVVRIMSPSQLSISWEMEASYPQGFARLAFPEGQTLQKEAERLKTKYSVTFEGLSPGTTYQCRVMNRGYLGRDIKVAGPLTIDMPPSAEAALSVLESATPESP